MRGWLDERADTLAVLRACGRVRPAATTRSLDGNTQIGAPFFHHGDVVVRGNLELTSSFLVTGSVTVEGLFEDCGPDSFVVIGEDLHASVVYTDGDLHVGRAVVAEHLVYGWYNDHQLVAETVRAPLVIEDDHVILGEIEATHTLDVYRDRDRAMTVLPDLLVPEVFGPNDDGEQRLDRERLFTRIRTGQRVFTHPASE